MDEKDIVEKFTDILEDGTNKKDEGLKPKSRKIAFILFAFIGLSHIYSWTMLAVSVCLFIGICTSWLIQWNITREERFSRWGDMLIQFGSLAAMHYATGWLVRAVLDFFGLSLT